jgi:hypothetical protein
MAAVVVTLRALAEAIGAEAEDTELWGPFIRFRTVNETDSDCCLDWRADIVVWTSAGDEVLVGFVDFLTLKADSREDDEMSYLLDSVSESAATFSPFFQGRWLDPDVEESLGAGHVEYVVLVTYVFVESPLRSTSGRMGRLGGRAPDAAGAHRIAAHGGRRFDVHCS